MKEHEQRKRSRREFLGVSAAFLIASSVTETRAQGGPRRPTPACGDSPVTPAQTAGPYFKPNSPQRASLLEPGMAGTRIVVEGTVLTTDCKPIPRALLDFWQADDQGQYDNTGHRLRGHLFTDDAGRYRLESIVPGLYPGRTRHFHVRVQAPNQPALTTQLYLPGETWNQRDSIFHPDLVLKVRDEDRAKLAAFDFVLDGRSGRGR